MTEYWRERELKHIKKQIKDDAQIAKKIRGNQIRAMEEIQEQIEAFYGRYADKEGISMDEARKRVTKLDMEKYQKKAKRYVKGAHSSFFFIRGRSFTERANEEMRLYNATMKINRLQLLKLNIELELIAAISDEEHFLFEELTKQVKAEYERLSGILGETINYNEKQINSIVNSSFQSATWSDRLWSNQNALRSELDKLLNRGIVQGKNPRVLARELRKVFNTSVYNSERLMRTEMGRLQIQVQEDSYKQAGFDQYVVIVEPDGCDICKKFDDKVFDVKDMEVSVNAPVFHPQCRCSTSAYFSREKWDENLKRRGL